MSMKKRWFALFTVPLFFVFIVVVIIPFLTGVYYSFFLGRTAQKPHEVCGL